MDESNTPSYLSGAIPAQIARVPTHATERHKSRPRSTSRYSLENWFEELQSDLISATGNQDSSRQRLSQIALDVITQKVNKWKKRMLADPQRTFSRNTHWVNQIVNCFKYSDEHNELRSTMLKTPRMLKKVFMVVVGDSSKDLSRGRREYYNLTGDDEDDEKIVKRNAKMSRSHVDQIIAVSQSNYTGGRTPWTLQSKLTSNALPHSMVIQLHDAVGNEYADNNTIKDMFEMMQRGAKWSEFSIEPEMLKEIDIGQADSDFFRQSSMSRPFGPKVSDPRVTTDLLKKWCKIFAPIRDVLYGAESSACSTYEDLVDEDPVVYDNDDDDDLDQRQRESMFMPEVPTAELTGMQRDFIWTCMSPVFLGVMYPWFSRPNDEARRKMTDFYHSSFFLSAHGLSPVGREFVCGVVPFFAQVVSAMRSENKKNPGSQKGVHMRFTVDEEEHCRRIFINQLGDWTDYEEKTSYEMAKWLENDVSPGGLSLTKASPEVINLQKYIKYKDAVAPVTTPTDWDTFTDDKTEHGGYVCCWDGLVAETPQFHMCRKDNQYFMSWHPLLKNGIPCHNKNIIDCYRKHFENVNNLFTNVAEHNMRLFRREFLYSDTSQYKRNTREQSYMMHGQPGRISGQYQQKRRY